MKRYLALFLAAVMLFALAGTGGAEEVRDLGGITITFGVSGTGTSAPDETTESGAREKKWRDELEAKYNFKFAYEAVPGDDTALLEKFVTTTIAGEPFCDVASTALARLPGLVNANLVYPLNTLKSFDFVSDPALDPSVVESATMADGNTYAYSTSNYYEIGERYFVTFNKSLAEREGLPDLYELYKNGEWTWDKMIEYCAKVTRDLDGDGVNDQFGYTADVYYLALCFACSTGHTPLVDGKTVNYSNPEILKAMEAYAKLNEYIMSAPEGANWDWYIKQFGEGKTLFLPASTAWMIGFYGAITDDYGFLPFPAPEPGMPYYTVTSWQNLNVVPYNTKDPEAVAFVIGLLSQPRPWDYDENGDLITDPLQDTIDGAESAVRDYESLEFVEYLLTEMTVLVDIQTAYNLFWATPGWGGYVGNILNGSMTPEQAAQAYTAPTQEIIDNF